jgi:hypothetical protein
VTRRQFHLGGTVVSKELQYREIERAMRDSNPRPLAPEGAGVGRPSEHSLMFDPLRESW